MAKVRATRRMRYGTRMLRAGDEFEINRRSHLRLFKQIGYVEPTPEPAPTVAESRRRPRRAVERKEPAVEEPAVEEMQPVEQQAMAQVSEPAAEETPETEAAADVPDDLNDRTRDELLALASERGLELGPGYTRKDELVEMLSGVGESKGWCGSEP